eukprot:377475_1
MLHLIRFQENVFQKEMSVHEIILLMEKDERFQFYSAEVLKQHANLFCLTRNRSVIQPRSPNMSLNPLTVISQNRQNMDLLKQKQKDENEKKKKKKKSKKKKKKSKNNNKCNIMKSTNHEQWKDNSLFRFRNCILNKDNDIKINSNTPFVTALQLLNSQGIIAENLMDCYDQDKDLKNKIKIKLYELETIDIIFWFNTYFCQICNKIKVDEWCMVCGRGLHALHFTNNENKICNDC